MQYVARQNGCASDDFRGYLGEIKFGSVRKGQKIRVLPGVSEATVTEIYLGNGSGSKGNNAVESAQTGEAAAIQLAEDIDVSRGSLFISAEDTNPPVLSKQLSADLCWLDSEPLSLSRKYARVTPPIRLAQRLKISNKSWMFRPYRMPVMSMRFLPMKLGEWILFCKSRLLRTYLTNLSVLVRLS